MKVILKRLESGEPIGWEISAESEEEITIVNTIRNLQFFGFNDTNIVYKGRTGGTSDYTNAGTLHWIQKKHR
jgi:hypothetical protein